MEYWKLVVSNSKSNLDKPKSNFWMGVQNLQRFGVADIDLCQSEKSLTKLNKNFVQ